MLAADGGRPRVGGVTLGAQACPVFVNTAGRRVVRRSSSSSKGVGSGLQAADEGAERMQRRVRAGVRVLKRPQAVQ